MPEIDVPFEPVAKARPRFGNGRTYTPRRTEVAEGRIRAAWLASGYGHHPGPLYLVVVARLARPGGHYGRRGTLLPSAPAYPAGKPDLDNYLKTALDGLSGAAYRDDAVVVSLTAVKTYARDGEVPGWRIGVFPVEVTERDADDIAIPDPGCPGGEGQARQAGLQPAPEGD